jgi:hypothetical protein
MPGPMPNPNHRRRNQPTIATTQLPASGRSGPAPRVPAPIQLAKAGKAWWRWAWSTPQAVAWDAGALQILGRRASLEDDLAALADVESLDLSELDDETNEALSRLLRRLAALATGRVAIIREMREHDRTLGLTPKAMAELRWSITRVEVIGERGATRPTGRDRLKVVDPALIHAKAE